MEQDLKQIKESIPRPEDHEEIYEITQLNFVKRRIVEAMCNNKREARLNLLFILLPSVREHLEKLGYRLEDKQNQTIIYW